jgi:hypothetical protein
MRRRGERSRKAKPGANPPKQQILSDHQKVGRRYIPPILQLGPFSDVKWVECVLPEVLWLGLLNEAYGVAKGAELALGLARAAVKTAGRKKWYGSTSAYAALDEVQKIQILNTLATNDRELLQKAFLPFLLFYPRCPLTFIFEDNFRWERESKPKKVLAEFKAFLAALFDKLEKPATFMQANGVYIAFVTGKLQVAKGLSLANFPAIEKYPETEDSRRVASGVRMAVNMFIGMAEQLPNDWQKYFWNRGLELEPCELAPIEDTGE